MVLSMSLGSRHKVVFNEETKEYDFYENNIIVPREIDSLYKYYTLNENTISSLMGCFMWLSNPASFNDPFDCNKNLIVDYAEDSANVSWDTRNHFDDIGIASFTEDDCHPLMWAHYTNNYNGLVIEFDSKLEDFFTKEDRNHKLRWRKVIYADYIGPMQKAFPFSKEVMLTTKLPFWQYEKEWRLIGNITKPNNRYLSFNPRKVKKIYVGYNLVKNNNAAMHIIMNIRHTRYPHAEIWWVRPSSNQYGAYEIRKFDIESIDKISYPKK